MTVGFFLWALSSDIQGPVISLHTCLMLNDKMIYDCTLLHTSGFGAIHFSIKPKLVLICDYPWVTLLFSIWWCQKFAPLSTAKSLTCLHLIWYGKQTKMGRENLLFSYGLSLFWKDPLAQALFKHSDVAFLGKSKMFFYPFTVNVKYRDKGLHSYPHIYCNNTVFWWQWCGPKEY